MQEFSFETRKQNIARLQQEEFDLLIIGGGITGAAVARDAVSRGLRVALVEKRDFAFGTSSRSSKLIHGGLRYLENFEFGLVFEALSERAHLLKTAPHMVKPLPFFMPVYEGDSHSKWLLSIGLWLYDILALFRTPKFHRNLSKKAILKQIPFLKTEGLKGGFFYYDASMLDDVLVVETLRSAAQVTSGAASQAGAAIANYVEAIEPQWQGKRISGFKVKDLESQPESPEFKDSWVIRAHRTVICAGPWTDLVGTKLSPSWRNWLSPSKGIHLIFDLKRLPIPGAMVMNHPADGRVSFVIPRTDFGQGVVIVGTTDGPSPKEPEKAEISKDDVQYLMELLQKYFPELKLTTNDILSAYIGVRPLVENVPTQSQEAQAGALQNTSTSLQKVSREHYIDVGPGQTVIVAGGKYTTHRKMAEEIVDFILKQWKQDAAFDSTLKPLVNVKRSETAAPVNPEATLTAIQIATHQAQVKGKKIPPQLLERYGASALEIVEDIIEDRAASTLPDPEGFPNLAAQLRYSIRHEMVVHLEDFYLRRIPLYLCRKDHGLPYAKELAQIWAEERGLGSDAATLELHRLTAEIQKRSEWTKLV